MCARRGGIETRSFEGEVITASPYLFHVMRERDMEKSRVCICKRHLMLYWHD